MATRDEEVEARTALPTLVFFCDTPEDAEATGVPQGCQVAYVRLLPSDIEAIADRVAAKVARP